MYYKTAKYCLNCHKQLMGYEFIRCKKCKKKNELKNKKKRKNKGWLDFF